MVRAMRHAAALLALATACATPPPPRPIPPRPVERSSIDVLLSHRAELALTDDQVKQLEALDAAREAEVADVRERLRARHEAAEGQRGVAPGRGMNSMGAGRGMAGMGGMRGGGMRGGITPRGSAQDDEEHDSLAQRLDDADTRSFITAAEKVLTPEQRPRAEQLASAYRATLFDFREAMRQRRQSPE